MSTTSGTILSLETLKQLSKEPQLLHTQVFDLLATLATDDEEVRAYACDCLEQLEQLSPEWIGELGKLCDQHYAPIAYWACKLLDRIGSEQSQAPLVRALCTHPSIDVRQQAALALSHFPHLSDEAFAALSVAAASEDPRLHRIAQRYLDQSS